MSYTSRSIENMASDAGHGIPAITGAEEEETKKSYLLTPPRLEKDPTNPETLYCLRSRITSILLVAVTVL
jgi:hypothetical protein